MADLGKVLPGEIVSLDIYAVGRGVGMGASPRVKYGGVPLGALIASRFETCINALGRLLFSGSQLAALVPGLAAVPCRFHMSALQVGSARSGRCCIFRCSLAAAHPSGEAFLLIHRSNTDSTYLTMAFCWLPSREAILHDRMPGRLRQSGHVCQRRAITRWIKMESCRLLRQGVRRYERGYL